jgi:DNA recombination protein RmuC
VAVNLKTFGETITGTMKDHAAAQKAQQDFFSTQLQKLTETNEDKLAAVKDVLEQRLSAIQEENGNKLDQMRVGTSTSSKDMRDEVNLSLKNFNDSVLKTMTQLSDAQTKEMETFSAQLGLLTESNQARLEALKVAVEAKLQSLQEDNAKQLDQMRATVDEKLQGTLEKRLGESFRQVSERLEQVSKGLGEMQSLATGVGDLKKVLTNVKARGTWGEVQLGNLLEQVLSPEQYEANVAPKGGSERVEFAIKLPGRTDKADEVVWLPIDAKWPVEDYQRLTEAQERGDAIASEAAILQLELRIKQCAKDISEKYLNPPKTTDFGILFLPTEGLFAEVIRRSALVEVLQVKYRVIVAGPTTLWSILSSLQMGFRTLAIQKRSSEVWTLLAAVKTEWGKYGAVLTKVQKKLQEASNTMEEANKRNRAVGRKLRDVQDLPTTEASSLLMLDSAISIDGDDDVEAEDPGDVGGAS